MSPDDDFLPLFLREVSHLRDAGAAFARRYPHVAGALDLSAEVADDPQVDRLVESFAYLSARLRQQYDARFPEIPTALLQATHPHLTAPVPAMAVAQFEVEAAHAAAVAGLVAPRHSVLFASTPSGVECRFRTAYPVELWPLTVAGVALQALGETRLDEAGAPSGKLARATTALRVALRRVNPAAPPAAAAPARLRFHLAGERVARHRLYELLCNALVGIAVAEPDSDTVRHLPARIRPVGFEADEDVLPTAPSVHAGHRLLQEYFAFPDKFLFLDVEGLPPQALGDGDADLVFLLSDGHADDLRLNAQSMRLGCTPVVNLFPRTSEPIRLDHATTEYLLQPDARHAATTEVHTVLGVSRTAAPQGPGDRLWPFLSAAHPPILDEAPDRDGLRWLERRQPVSAGDMPGSEVLLSFVDPNLRVDRPAEDVLFAQLLCTNRGLARQVGPRTRLEIEADLKGVRIHCLDAPTPQRDPPAAGESLWRLVSHLTLNQLSLASDARGRSKGPDALRGLLALYAGHGERARNLEQAAGLAAMEVRPAVAYLDAPPVPGFVRGQEITAVFDESRFPGGSAYLMASVLERFLALYAGVNSFTRLQIRRQGQAELWKRWPARAGERFVL